MFRRWFARCGVCFVVLWRNARLPYFVGVDVSGSARKNGGRIVCVPAHAVDRASFARTERDVVLRTCSDGRV